MKIWIHQIKESMGWQERNYKLLKSEWEKDPTQERLDAYIKSYGQYKQLKGNYEQWHTDRSEQENREAHGMKLIYSSLRGGNRFVVNFDYSSVTSRPDCYVEEWKDGYDHTDKGAVPTHELISKTEFSNQAAIDEVRKHVASCQEYTTLHDR